MRSLDLTAVTWHKSSYSNQDGGQCLEVADGFTAVVPVRDSKYTHNSSPTLMFTADGWSSFVSALKCGVMGS
ncbi:MULTISPECIES: DUF397 domain-containing protein [Streptomyces]|uniref:DUF397 domain-containing protein n=1 Tax=Streptomyces mutomycini TaxID=284036 RepID=A0ABW0B178_9ACTN|nr:MULTISPECIES: DUF397 domain-containing protein [Streptomyces]KPC78370.1 hypothetical protein ADK82_30530 [Streptomyces sp. NRRL S-4]